MKVYNEIEQAFSDGHDSRDEEVADLDIEIKRLKKENKELKDKFPEFYSFKELEEIKAENLKLRRSIGLNK